MVLDKKRKLGRKIEEISVEEKLSISEKVEDKDLLLYLGLTDDANPLYIQHDYASQTPYENPIVPSIMLAGMISSAVSKYLPGPGSHILSQNIQFLKPVYHYSTIHFLFKVVEVNISDHLIKIEVTAENDRFETVLDGSLTVSPPYRLEGMNGKALENF
ncbi:MaoC/PaaZ C-terminal domain-containing protein [Bacillota bacterium Lsc_1132]